MTATTRASKIHVSLAPDLAAFIERRRAERKITTSAAVAESIRRDMLAERQDRLDQALALDAGDSEAFARASVHAVSRVLARDAE